MVASACAFGSTVCAIVARTGLSLVLVPRGGWRALYSARRTYAGEQNWERNVDSVIDISFHALLHNSLSRKGRVSPAGPIMLLWNPESITPRQMKFDERKKTEKSYILLYKL